MNRPLFFGSRSLPRRFIDVKVSLLFCLLLYSSTVLTVLAEQLQGCSLDQSLCESTETCVPDGLFGQCFSPTTPDSVPLLTLTQPLTPVQKELLRLQLINLAEQNYDWPHPMSQCVLGYFKIAVKFDLPFDDDFCKVRNPANIWTLLQRVQSVLANSATADEQLVDEELPEQAILFTGLENVSENELPEDELAAVEMAEPAFLIDPANNVALPVVIVDELAPAELVVAESPDGNDNEDNEVGTGHSIVLSTGPLTVQDDQENSTAPEENPAGLTEADMGDNSENINQIVSEILEENNVDQLQKRTPKKDLSSDEEKQLEQYVHNLLINKKDELKKLSETQVGKLFDLVTSLQAELQHSQPEESSAPEIEEIVPLTSLSNEQQLMLKKDVEKYNFDDMGLANTVHKIVKGDFQRVDGNHVYLRIAKQDMTEEELVKLIEFLDKKIAQPNNMFFDDFKFQDGQLSFRVLRLEDFKETNEKRVNSVSGVAQAVYKRRKDIQTMAGVEVDETGIGSGRDAVPVESKDRDWMFYPILGVCALTIITLFTVLAVHLVKNRKRPFQSNLPEVIDHLDGKSVMAYEDLCRQRMSTQETPSAVTIGAAPTKTGSTSSWPDEGFIQSCNLDISTGHVILSFLKEHLDNPGKIADQWHSVSGYFNANAISTIANEPQNVDKNRDQIAVPYDDNVVTTENGYVNASRIYDSDPRHCSYIVTQAPLENTIQEYWQLVWEQGVALIVNLCCMNECERYWPEEGTQIYGNFEVNLVSEHIWSEDYVVRSFYLKSLKSNETRTVTQFHYLSWKKNSVPALNKSLLEFRRKVNKSYRGRASPILVHDFNGAGRAGTYCLIDVVSNRIHKGVKEIDIAASLEHLRDQRAFLVANGEQYKMVFSCVAEEVTNMIKLIQH